MHSADHVLPEFQHPQVGDTIGYGPNRMRVERWSQSVFSPGAPRMAIGYGHSSSGSRRLDATDKPQPFRLPSLGARLGMVPMEPASLIMERKMLRGIKLRAERLASTKRRGTGTVRLPLHTP